MITPESPTFSTVLQVSCQRLSAREGEMMPAPLPATIVDRETWMSLDPSDEPATIDEALPPEESQSLSKTSPCLPDTQIAPSEFTMRAMPCPKEENRIGREPEPELPGINVLSVNCAPASKSTTSPGTSRASLTLDTVLHAVFRLV